MRRHLRSTALFLLMFALLLSSCSSGPAADIGRSTTDLTASQTEPAADTVSTAPTDDSFTSSEVETEPITETISEEVSETIAETVARSVHDAILEVMTETLPEEFTEALTEAITEAVTEAVTETLTELFSIHETTTETAVGTSAAGEPEPTSAPEGSASEPTSSDAAESEETEAQVTYIANLNSKKFHYPDCPSVDDMKEENKWRFTGTREELIALGYKPCKRCNP